ncbi:MAG: GGDEF domain-containing protein [Gammaproteobacteria bacterium]|nr:GGDEF domain-containing protein [Gammaproteobacteria bacterium]
MTDSDKLDSTQTFLIDTMAIFDHMATPVWVYDVSNYRICWANKKALDLWHATSKTALLERDLAVDITEATDRQLRQLLQDTKGKTCSLWWTVYPQNFSQEIYIRYSNLQQFAGKDLLLCEGIVSRDELERDTSFTVGNSMASLFNASGELISCNQKFQAVYDQITIDIHELVEMSSEELAEKFSGAAEVEFERQVIHLGKICWFNFTIRRLLPENHYLVIQDNITERKTREHKYLHLAYHDQLTGLLNRYGLDEYLKHRCYAKQQFHLFLINIDAFKLINNNLGHKTGDAVLVAIAKRLLKQLPERYQLARFGGDEFIIIVPADPDSQSIEAIGHLIIDTIALPIIELDSIQLTASIGTATFPDDALEPDSLIMYADTAMHKAKELSSRSFCSFARQMSLEIQRRAVLQQGLKHALLFEELVPLFQPIVDMKTNKLVGMEALLSWHSPQLGKVSPQEFVPEAERSGMMNEIGQWILTKACQQCLLWHQESGVELKLSVNVSAIQLTDSFIDMLDDVLMRTKFPPHKLILELTESIFLLNINQVIKRLKAISDRGIGVCIDDFGTGYSSLSYIHKLPISTIKIDRSFIADIDSSDVVIEATVAMANKLGLNIVAEGIESQYHLERMMRYPNLLAQGYYYSRPVNAADFVKLPLYTELLAAKAKGN